MTIESSNFPKPKISRSIHRQKLVEYLANPCNDWPPRVKYGEILGINHQNVYRHFGTTGLNEIEQEALALRRASLAADTRDTCPGRADRRVSTTLAHSRGTGTAGTDNRM
jgi:hypothetical protein